MALSKIRSNYHATSEALINKQINMELHASYVYMSMVSIANVNKNWDNDLIQTLYTS